MKPKVKLISFTPNAVPLMCYMRRVMHAPVPDTLEELKENPKKWLGMSINDYFKKVLLKDNMPTFLEAVSLFFKIENVSRATTHQLVRHRIGFSYSQQSLRCVRPEKFAVDNKFVNLGSVSKSKKQVFQESMYKIQKVYNNALAAGLPTQDARALLPMGIQTTLTFSCTLRALIGMVNKRLCFKAQDEVKEIAMQIQTLVEEKVDRRLGWFFGPPCKFGKCMMEAENEEQYVKGQFTGEQNTSMCCPVFVKKFKSDSI